MLAVFQSDGKVPWFRDDWKIGNKMGAISGAVLLKKYTGILPGPLAFLDWRYDS